MAKLERYYHATHVTIDAITIDANQKGIPIISCIVEYKGKPWKVIENATLVNVKSAFGMIKMIIRFDLDEDDSNSKTSFLTLFIETEKDIEEVKEDALPAIGSWVTNLFLTTQHQVTQNTRIFEYRTEVITIEDATLHETEKEDVLMLDGWVYKEHEHIYMYAYVYNARLATKLVETGGMVAAFEAMSYDSLPNCFNNPIIILVKNWRRKTKDLSESIASSLQWRNDPELVAATKDYRRKTKDLSESIASSLQWENAPEPIATTER